MDLLVPFVAKMPQPNGKTLGGLIGHNISLLIPITSKTEGQGEEEGQEEEEGEEDISYI